MIEVAIGADQHARHLRGERGEHVLDERLARDGQQALVHAAQAAGLPTGENNAGNIDLGCS